MTHCFEDILVHRHTQGQTNENGWMDKALLFTVTSPHPDGWVPVHYARAMGRA